MADKSLLEELALSDKYMESEEYRYEEEKNRFELKIEIEKRFVNYRKEVDYSRLSPTGRLCYFYIEGVDKGRPINREIYFVIEYFLYLYATKEEARNFGNQIQTKTELRFISAEFRSHFCFVYLAEKHHVINWINCQLTKQDNETIAKIFPGAYSVYYMEHNQNLLNIFK